MRDTIRDTRRGNIDSRRDTRRTNIDERRDLRRENIEARRLLLPPVEPVTVTAEGTIEYVPLAVAPAPTVAVPAPAPAAPPAAPTPPVSPPAGSTPPAAPPAGPNTPVAAPPAGTAAVEAGSDDDDPFAGSDKYDVVGIEDEGTTLVLKVDGVQSKVRLIGVAPMSLKAGGNLPAILTMRRRLPSTSTFLNLLLRGEQVYILYDSRVAEQDKAGKYVGYVYRAPDGLLVNQEVIRNGFAAADTRYEFDLKADFARYQGRAQKYGKGIFGMLAALKARRGVTGRRSR